MEFIFLFIPSGLNPYLIFNRSPISAPAPPAQLNPILLLFNRGRSGRSYWSIYFFHMPLRGVGPTLSPSCRLYGPEAGL